MQAEQQSEREALYTLIRGFGFTTFAQTWKIVDAIMARAALSHPSTPQGWQQLTDEDRERAMRSMPDMLDGFMKTWGWLHFAKAIEAICREKNAAPHTKETSP